MLAIDDKTGKLTLHLDLGEGGYIPKECKNNLSLYLYTNPNTEVYVPRANLRILGKKLRVNLDRKLMEALEEGELCFIYDYTLNGVSSSGCKSTGCYILKV
jgi:hypothetical protein